MRSMMGKATLQDNLCWRLMFLSLLLLGSMVQAEYDTCGYLDIYLTCPGDHGLSCCASRAPDEVSVTTELAVAFDRGSKFEHFKEEYDQTRKMELDSDSFLTITARSTWDDDGTTYVCVANGTFYCAYRIANVTTAVNGTNAWSCSDDKSQVTYRNVSCFSLPECMERETCKSNKGQKDNDGSFSTRVGWMSIVLVLGVPIFMVSINIG